MEIELSGNLYKNIIMSFITFKSKFICKSCSFESIFPIFQFRNFLIWKGTRLLLYTASSFTKKQIYSAFIWKHKWNFKNFHTKLVFVAKLKYKEYKNVPQIRTSKVENTHFPRFGELILESRQLFNEIKYSFIPLLQSTILHVFAVLLLAQNFH